MNRNGGPVNAGKPYVVGERGPEWFVPGMPGVIIGPSVQVEDPAQLVRAMRRLRSRRYRLVAFLRRVLRR